METEVIEKTITLKVLKEPVFCPECNEAGRMGFLKRIMNADEHQAIINSSVDFECRTCFALFEVEQNGL